MELRLKGITTCVKVLLRNELKNSLFVNLAHQFKAKKEMKNLFLSFAVVVLSSITAFSQEAKQVASGPQISVDKEVYDYGTIKKGANGTGEFTITNTGNAPLIISRAKGSCGCTVPEWPKEPIMPGASSVMSVRYDTKRVGPINKSVTVSSNATNGETKVVRIKGTVIDAENVGDAPVKKGAMVPMTN